MEGPVAQLAEQWTFNPKRVGSSPTRPIIPGTMRDYVSLPADELDRFVQRSKASSALPALPDVPLLLRGILRKAAELVPSEAGRILLDDPMAKVERPTENDLHTVAAFGGGAEDVMGEAAPATEGMAGRVYTTQTSFHETRAEPAGGVATAAERLTRAPVRTVIAAPIVIGGTTCGTMELYNRLGGDAYDEHDLVLLELFAAQVASGIQNALDARHAQDLAKIDDLTGLYNDRYLHVRLREELERASRAGETCALLFLDLDHFKPINDTHGHLVGSQVLREMGYLLRRVMADEDAVLARYGGDEFTIMLPGRTARDALGIAERIRSAIETAVFLDRDRGTDLPALQITGAVTASIGVADTAGLELDAGDTAQTLIRIADEAMYAAKAAGKNRVVRVSTA